jgi:uncharacterized protein (UPF0332 family)
MIPLRLKERDVGPHKGVVKPLFGERNVLTNSSWIFVTLWLKRNKKNDALFYWEQAYEFHKASVGLPIQSAPLLLYYCFMNAVKALLVAKGIPFEEHHGVRAHNMRQPKSKVSLSNEGVRILTRGIVPSLSSYYREAEKSSIHSLQELLFNMVFIHRTYCLTYTSQPEMFLALANCTYAIDDENGQVFFRADFASNVLLKNAVKRLPIQFRADSSLGDRAIRSVGSVSWTHPARPTETERADLALLNGNLRRDLHFINAAQTLWYVKMVISRPKRIQRQLPTMILTAMHRLSEICRYRPLELASYLSGQKNWLLSEFIQMSTVQFIDEIASELTGQQFLVPNVRVPV